MSIGGLTSAIVSSLDTEIAALRSVKTHGGQFNVQELRRVAVYAPAALVTVSNGDVTRHAGSTGVGTLTIDVFVVTGGTSAVGRDDGALLLVQSIVGLAVRNDWAYADAGPPKAIKFRNLYSGQLDSKGVALWAVRWQQDVEIDAPTIDDLDELRSLYINTDLADKDGVVEDQQIIQLQGTLMSAYGQIYVSSSAATSIAVADTYQKAAGTTTLLRADGFDMPANGRLRHTDDVTRPVAIEVPASVSVDSDAKVTLTLAVNGVPVEEAEVEEELTSAGGAESMVVKAIVELGENDYVEPWVKADSTVNVTLTKVNVVAVAT